MKRYFRRRTALHRMPGRGKRREAGAKESGTRSGYSGTTGKRVERFEYDGDGLDPMCDVATDGKRFAAITADGKITVWSLAEKTKALEGFDPYADKPEHKKAGLAGLFFARNSNNLVTVSTAGAVHLFEIATRKQIGEFVPPKSSAGRVVVGKNVAADDGRASVVLLAGGVVYQISTLAPLSVPWRLERRGPRSPARDCDCRRSGSGGNRVRDDASRRKSRDCCSACRTTSCSYSGGRIEPANRPRFIGPARTWP